MSYGGIGEVVNTVDCGSIMQGFDSLISPHRYKLLGLFQVFLIVNNLLF